MEIKNLGKDWKIQQQSIVIHIYYYIYELICCDVVFAC